jgi:transcriptional regulator with XRE-family HTH domain
MAINNQDRSRLPNSHRHSHWRERLMATMQSPTENPYPEEINIGGRLREIRVKQGLSIRSLAEKSGLNFNTLSLIENEKTSPNVNTLQQLAVALRVPITVFFETSTIYKDVVFQKSGHRPQSMFPQGLLEDLGGGLALGEATPLLLTSDPRTNSGADAIIHTGQEFVYCLEGCMAYWVGPDEYILEPGDSLIFQAHLPHRWENRSDSLFRSVLVICPSDNDDHLVEDHLVIEMQEK